MPQPPLGEQTQDVKRAGDTSDTDEERLGHHRHGIPFYVIIKPGSPICRPNITDKHHGSFIRHISRFAGMDP